MIRVTLPAIAEYLTRKGKRKNMTIENPRILEKMHISTAFLEGIAWTMRPARATVPPLTDDFNDLDYAGADIRISVRRILIADMGQQSLVIRTS